MTLTLESVRSASAYVDTWLAYRRELLRAPGVQAAVLFDGELVLSVAHGHADVDAGVELTTAHLFRVASHSKTFTATALFQLAESGVLTIDDTAGRWLPWLTEPVSKVTLREMLAHSSGIIRDGEDADFWQLSRPFPDVDELRSIAMTRADVLPANERFKYSNITFSLLGLVIEAATGRTYNTYVAEEIVARLELANTGPELDEARATEYAAGYSSLTYAPERQLIEHVDTRAMSAATGFYSTAADLCRYFAAHFPGDPRLLSDASKRLMQHQWWDIERTPDNAYGLGLSIAKVGERWVFGHGGGYPGHITRTMFDPGERLAVSVLTNAIDGPAGELAAGIVRLIDLASRQEPLPDNGQSRFCGRFANLWTVRDVVSFQGRLLLLDPTVADPTESYADLVVVDDTTLRVTAGPGYGAVGETLTYTFGPDGSTHSVRGPGGLTVWPLATYRLPAGRITVPD